MLDTALFLGNGIRFVQLVLAFDLDMIDLAFSPYHKVRFIAMPI